MAVKPLTYKGTWVPAGYADLAENLATALAAHIATQTAAGWTLVTTVPMHRAPVGVICIWSQ